MAKQKNKPNKLHYFNFFLRNKVILTLIALTFITLVFLIYQYFIFDKFIPGIFFGSSSLAFLQKPQAQRLILYKFNQKADDKLQFRLQEQTVTIDLATSSATLDLGTALNEGFELGHSGDFFTQLYDQVKTLIFKKSLEPKITINLDPQTKPIAQAINREAKDATLEIITPQATISSQVKITADQNGYSLDQDKLLSETKSYLVFDNYPTSFELPVKIVQPKITTQKILKAKEILEELLKEPVTLIFDNQTFTLDAKTTLSLMDLDKINSQTLDKERLTAYLVKNLTPKVNQPVVEALFNFDSTTGRVSAFKPAQEGRELDIEKTSGLVLLALGGTRSKTITLPIKITQPQTATANVNSLGIKELIGQGVSNFTGSIPNRIYNIGLAASKINGILIPPGEFFSFNNIVGDISAATGYKQAYVIKEGRTVLDDGGGVCQVSTTVFRTALNSGLPIVSRTAHAYRVGYYEQGFPPGLDATVFYPSVDFKFKNDTTSHILIQAYVRGTSLYVDFYGTSDGRVATLTKPSVTNVTPPPPEIRQDDPNLPKGTVKQVDWPAYGATVVFSRTVSRNGETINKDTFRSNYKAWQAVYLVGTQ